MPRILHLISHLEEGGAQRQLSVLLSSLQVWEMEIAVLVESPVEKRMAPFRSSEAPIHFLSRSSDFYAPEILPSLKRLMAQRKYDLVHCWLYQSIVQGVLACSRAKIPCIASPRSVLKMFDFDKNKRWEKYLIRNALRKASLVVFPSTTIAIDFIDSGWATPETCRIVRNAVDTEHYQPAGAGESVVAIGRVSVEKGYDDLYKIIPALRNEFPSISCLVAGSGPIPRQCPDIKFVGRIDDVRQVLKEAAVFVNTSYVEGLSNSLLEAQAMGIPAVARNIGGNSEVISHGYNGLLADSKEDFVNRISELMRDRVQRDQMSKNARETAEKYFSFKHQSEEYAAVYSELL